MRFNLVALFYSSTQHEFEIYKILARNCKGPFLFGLFGKNWQYVGIDAQISQKYARFVISRREPIFRQFG